MPLANPLDSTDVLVIGGGITGTAIARELSRYRVKTILVEKEADVACGVTKANNGMIHAGISAVVSNLIKSRTPGGYPQYGRLLRDRLCMASLAVYEQRARELGVRYRKVGRLVMARNEAEMAVLEQIRQAAEQAGLKGIQRVDQEGIRRLEPHVTTEAVAGLYDANEAVIFPPELTIALAENAQQNGLSLWLNTTVQGVERLEDGRLRVATSQGPIIARFVVNAAGLYADQVAALAGETDFHLSFAKGQLLIFDKRVSHLVNHTVCFTPAPNLVRFVSPTADGNLMAAGTYEKTADRRDFATTRQGLAETMAKAQELVPALSPNDVIASFAGLRATNSRNPEDYLIEPSPSLPQFINVVICPPGLTSAFGVAEMVVGMLAEQGLVLEEKPNFNPYRRAIVRFSELSHREKRALIARDPRYGHIVCRCEMVTEGEIVEAIRRGATTLDAIKRRTRVGMGRCQGGFDTPRVLQILARELGCPVEEITKMGRASRVAPFHSKELLWK
jgi:glycerol-3-phosphate dehydrogenase